MAKEWVEDIRAQWEPARGFQSMAANSSIEWTESTWNPLTGCTKISRVERREYSFRLDYLRRTGARVKFLSLEPLLGPLPDLDLTGIDWVIVGGESGPGARPISPAWVIDIRDQCRRLGIPFFFKQWGGFNRKKAGRLLEGRTWDEMPAV